MIVVTNLTTTSADYANFVMVVNTAISGRADLSFNAGTGTLTYTGDGNPMTDLLTNLGAANDPLVEGPEQVQGCAEHGGQHHGFRIALVRQDYHHHRNDTATWSNRAVARRSPKASPASYTCTLGRHAAGRDGDD